MQQISSGKRCKASQKRIGTSAFMVYPNNVGEEGKRM